MPRQSSVKQMRYYDALPECVRNVIANSNNDWDAVDVGKVWKRMALKDRIRIDGRRLGSAKMLATRLATIDAKQ